MADSPDLHVFGLWTVRFLQSLPDKGKRISEFAERVRLIIADQDEEERKRVMLSSARAEFQSKYQQAFTSHQRGVHKKTGALQQESPGEDVALHAVQEMEASPISPRVHENKTVDKQQDPSVAADESMETTAAEAALNSNKPGESDLVEALERVRLSDTTGSGSKTESKEPLEDTPTQNVFLGKKQPKKPHYIEVLEKTEKVPANRKQTFRLNQLPPKVNKSPSGSLSPRHSPGGSSPLSPQARREEDRKHLDDITAARLPPLHHSPAQLVSLEESARLLQEQTKRHQELQAKLAAQKLSEGLKITMESYSPDGGPKAAYREHHDDGAQLSSEED
ncbi:protein GRINL1A isoform X2 [Lampris incognitus]|uniref:protein GRINL1A isoform X2 n=1 Tax=Lampris incognitus TaxID=2546036 RepID=UPI0024B593AD|nr:protein GRINL1A isoform X2 [Lampris incognitus]